MNIIRTVGLVVSVSIATAAAVLFLKSINDISSEDNIDGEERSGKYTRL